MASSLSFLRIAWKLLPNAFMDILFYLYYFFDPKIRPRLFCNKAGPFSEQTSLPMSYTCLLSVEKLSPPRPSLSSKSKFNQKSEKNA